MNEELKILLETYTNLSGVRQGYVKRVIDSLKTKSSYNGKDIRKISECMKMIGEYNFKNTKENKRIVDNLQCELCGKPENVYQFRIVNSVTGQQIWTGSTCILKFGVKVYNTKNQLVLTDSEKEEIFKEGTNELREEKRISMIDSLLDDLQKDAIEYNSTHDVTQSTQLTVFNRCSSAFNRQGIYSIKQLKLISLLWKELYEEFMPFEVVKLFRLDMEFGRNISALKELGAFHWIQLSPILPKKFYNFKYGLNTYIINKSEDIFTSCDGYEKFRKSFEYKISRKTA